ncbi:hypothetical protein FP2506_15064 [Fulvimarina pelagi HTCC2506]|uniref:Lipoprotein n=1 Tax=Fulvimarina pelagi HTCC2506 TaxID=314231 RepID=Q0G3R7_9HYPH|nr:hypothetical protein [Fulvimarina pelagi]EAU41764.1 hypothetical protein FP2506_15064 [Fulvimarina pelagi HTCC2506]
MISIDARRILMKRTGQAVLFAGVAALSGCLGPTYGTGKSQGQMLFDDLNNIVALGGSSDAEPIAYTEREALRTPENTSVLPAPQQRTGPETARQRAARLQAAAYQGEGPVPASEMNRQKEGVTQDYLDRTRGSGYDFAKTQKYGEANVLRPDELARRSELYKQRMAERNAADRQTRKLLSEPPLDYRQPSAAAPVGEFGVDEATKERRLRGSQSLLSKVGEYLPF